MVEIAKGSMRPWGLVRVLKIFPPFVVMIEQGLCKRDADDPAANVFCSPSFDTLLWSVRSPHPLSSEGKQENIFLPSFPPVSRQTSWLH